MSRRTIGGYQPTDAGPIPEPPRSGSIALSKPTKLRRVKTIAHKLTTGAPMSNCDFFDAEVNAALADGWYLVKRYTLPGQTEAHYSLLVAELQRYDDYDE